MSVLADLRDWVGGGFRNGGTAPAISNSAAIPSSLVSRGSSIYEAFAGLDGLGADLPLLNERSALTVSAITGCVNLISGAICSLPVNIFAQKADGERTRLGDDPLLSVLNTEFSPRWVAHAGWDFLARSRLYHGDGFAEIIRQGSRVNGLRPIHPLLVQPAPWTDGSRMAYIISPDPWLENRERRVVDQDDMLHVPGWGFDGVRSVSPLRHFLKMAGSVALATQDYAGQFFANSARPDYQLEHPGNPTEQQVESLRVMLAEKHSRAAGNAFKPMILTGGMKASSLQLSNEDAELIATRGFQIEEIARAFGVPPFMIGHHEKSTSWGTGVAEMGAGFVRYTLRSHLNAFQNEINRKLLRTGGRKIEFDTFELERGDMKSMFEALRVALGRAGEPGFMTQNEARGVAGLNKMDDGDVLFDGGKSNAQPAI